MAVERTVPPLKITTPPETITPALLECVVMPNGEVICAGKSIGWVQGKTGIGKYLRRQDC